MIDTIEKLRALDPKLYAFGHKPKGPHKRTRSEYRRCSICTAELKPGVLYHAIIKRGGGEGASKVCTDCVKKARGA